MQKKIIALAIAGLASTAAFAQSNVTVYGIADVGYAYSFGGGQGSQHDVMSGGLSGSRIGFKGVEDLGNGLKALFTLEYSVDVDANRGIGEQVTSAGARQQFVGLTGGFGTVVAGRLQTAGYDFACATSPIAGSALDAHHKVGVAALLSCGGAGRSGNAFAYISPSFSGLTLAYNHARVTEQAASSNNDDAYANLLSAQYANGGLKLNLTYARINNDDRAHTALAADRNTEIGLTGSYNFGVASVFATYQTSKTNGTLNDDRNDKASVAVAVPVGAKGTVVGQYARNSIDTANNADSSAYTVAYTHALSKRTTAYAGYTHVVNDGGVNLAAGFQAVGAGKDPSVVALGVRHAF